MLQWIPNTITDFTQLKAPWNLEPLPTDVDWGTISSTLLSKEKNSNNSAEVHYTYSTTENPSIFHRYVVITPVMYSINSGNGTVATKDLKYRVASVVHWTELNVPKEVRLDTEITNWKK